MVARSNLVAFGVMSRDAHRQSLSPRLSSLLAEATRSLDPLAIAWYVLTDTSC
jgi:hypothetical protein